MCVCMCVAFEENFYDAELSLFCASLCRRAETETMRLLIAAAGYLINTRLTSRPAGVCTKILCSRRCYHITYRKCVCWGRAIF